MFNCDVMPVTELSPLIEIDAVSFIVTVRIALAEKLAPLQITIISLSFYVYETGVVPEPEPPPLFADG